MPNEVICVEAASKRYRLQHEGAGSLKNLLLCRGGRTEALWALHAVSFTVHEGETVGVVGHNGSGKSTLLGLLANVSRPTEGIVEVHGRVAPLLELGAGFHDDLTGIENIALHGSILGLSNRRMEELTPSIVDFAELGSFIDTPLRTWSAGMVMRLGFSIAVYSDPDVLLIDEVLAVGDEAFQQKCYDRIADFQRQGKTILFVSHDMEAVSRVASRVLWLKSGRLLLDGPASEVVAAYQKAAGRVD
ncbi:MAG TPA: ABC transporter ATP-binding protein [Armatimonadota bacterium]|jgi:ABC-type polysaccharide/polyol phosphate transport system ATPase subunit